jgi:DNA-binding PadR family transcriptional regulator
MSHPDESGADRAEDFLPLPTATFHILVALAEAERHGYAIMQEVAERTSGQTRLNPGTLYTTLRRLLEGGLIAELEGRLPGADERRRHYRITPFGRQVATLELERLSGMIRLGRVAGLAPRES